MQKRKQMRLPQYDYSQNGVYFVTICTSQKRNLFGDVGTDSPVARMIAEEFEKSISLYPQVSVPKYVVMPNHFHALIQIQKWDSESGTTLMEIVQTFKRRTTNAYIQFVKAGKAKPFDKYVWQRSFYDHVVRNEQDFREIWQYIDNNPLKWQLDKFYIKE